MVTIPTLHFVPSSFPSLFILGILFNITIVSCQTEPVTFISTISAKASRYLSFGYLDVVSSCAQVETRFTSLRTGTVTEVHFYGQRNSLDNGFKFNISILDDNAGSPGTILPDLLPYVQDSSAIGKAVTDIRIPIDPLNGWNLTYDRIYWLRFTPADYLIQSGCDISLFITSDFPTLVASDHTADTFACPPGAIFSSFDTAGSSSFVFELVGFGPVLPTYSPTASATATVSSSASASASGSASASVTGSASLTPLPSASSSFIPSASPKPPPDTAGNTMATVLAVSLSVILVGGGVIFYKQRKAGNATSAFGSSGYHATKGMNASQIAQITNTPPVYDDDDDPALKDRFRAMKLGNSSRSDRVSRASSFHAGNNNVPYNSRPSSTTINLPVPTFTPTSITSSPHNLYRSNSKRNLRSSNSGNGSDWGASI